MDSTGQAYTMQCLVSILVSQENPDSIPVTLPSLFTFLYFYLELLNHLFKIQDTHIEYSILKIRNILIGSESVFTKILLEKYVHILLIGARVY